MGRFWRACPVEVMEMINDFMTRNTGHALAGVVACRGLAGPSPAETGRLWMIKLGAATCDTARGSGPSR